VVSGDRLGRYCASSRILTAFPIRGTLWPRRLDFLSFTFDGGGQDVLPNSQLPLVLRKQGVSATEALTLLFRDVRPDFAQEQCKEAE
jgi:hypothetical protein